MGLFEKKECMICGKKVGLFGTRLFDGYICSGCDADLIPQFLYERANSELDSFELGLTPLAEAQACGEYFNNGNVLKKLTKELPQYLDSFAVDEVKREIELSGKKAVYRVPTDAMESIIYLCRDEKAVNPKFIFIILAPECSWLHGYTFEGTFKPIAFFSSTTIKKIQADVAKMATQTGIHMISYEDFMKEMKKAQRAEQIESMKKLFSKIK